MGRDGEGLMTVGKWGGDEMKNKRTGHKRARERGRCLGRRNKAATQTQEGREMRKEATAKEFHTEGRRNRGVGRMGVAGVRDEGDPRKAGSGERAEEWPAKERISTL